MTLWSDQPQRRLVDHLTPVSADLRDSLFRGPFTAQGHDDQFDALMALREIERGGPAPARGGVAGPARLIFWNVERLRHLDAIAHHLQALAPDVILLSEVDRGMARTGNTDRAALLSKRLALGYLTAVEFIELGLGDIHEQRDNAGQSNLHGLHGAAIFSDVTLQSPALVRLERRGNWFGLDRHEPRVGGTIAMLASVQIMGTTVLMANVHLESHETPQSRAQDLQKLLRLIEDIAPGGPVVIGGDMNTSTGSYQDRHADPLAWAARLAGDPLRLLRPQPYEPLFGALAAMGYDWQSCNLPDQPTTRYPAGSARRPAKIDWVFTRGLSVSDVAIVPTVMPDSTPASDHEGLMLTVWPDGASADENGIGHGVKTP